MTPWGWMFKQGMRILRHERIRPHALQALVTEEEYNLLNLSSSGYLYEKGWIRSTREHRSVDLNGEPLPWCTYPYIDFVAPRLTKDMRVFEFGSGYSTQFYAARVAEVHAVEHDAAWVEKLQGQLPAQAHLAFVPLEENGEYCRQALSVGGVFDLIVVDGRDRVNCLRQSLGALSPQGVLVLDNAQREKYQPGMALVQSAGFRRLDFHGLSPLKAEGNITTVFYKSDNVLGI